MKHTCYDVCIIGTGITGALAAYKFALSGREVIVLDKRNQSPLEASIQQPILLPLTVFESDVSLRDLLLRLPHRLSPHPLGFILPDYNHIRIPNSLSLPGFQTTREGLIQECMQAAAAHDAQFTYPFPVGTLTFDAKEKMWAIHHQTGEKNPLFARCLITTEGAPALLKKQLGLPHQPPAGMKTRFIIPKGMHQLTECIIYVFQPRLKPGYMMIQQSKDHALYITTYFPFAQALRPEEYLDYHVRLFEKIPYLHHCLGKNPALQFLDCRPIRFGGIPETVADHVLVLGEAAGQADPLTYQSFPQLLYSINLLVAVVNDAFRDNDLSAKRLQKFHSIWSRESKREWQAAEWLEKWVLHTAWLRAVLTDTKSNYSSRLLPFLHVLWGNKPVHSLINPGFLLSLFKERWFTGKSKG